MSSRCYLAPAVLILLVLHVNPALAQSYSEDFSTTLFRDSLETTAVWDTVSQELRLPSFTPTAAGLYNTSGEALRVVVAGRQAYVADGSAGLQIVDIGDPSSPVITGTLDTPGTARDVAVSGNLAYLADGPRGFRAIDVTVPSAPFPYPVHDVGGDYMCVAVSGDYAYVGNSLFGLLVMDVRFPNPVWVGPAVRIGFEPVDVAIDGDLLVVCDNTGFGFDSLLVSDCSDPVNPVQVGSSPTLGPPEAVALFGTVAFVAVGTAGLEVFDLSDPTNPVSIGSCDTPGSALDVFVSGDQAYVADGASGVHVVDIADPSNPFLTGGSGPSNQANGVFVEGDYAFVADDVDGLRVLSIGDPTGPVSIYNDPAPPTIVAEGSFLSGDILYLAAGYDVEFGYGLWVIDVSDPASPAVLGYCEIGDFWSMHGLFDVHVQSDYAYVACTYDGVHIVDVADPANPVLVGDVAGMTCAYGVTAAGNYAYAVCGSFFVLDITDPSAPSVVQTVALSSVGRDVTVSGNYAYVANGVNGMVVVDIAIPSTAFLSGPGATTPGTAFDVFVAGDLAYVADGASGLQIFDIMNPNSPWLVGSSTAPGFALSLFVSGNRAYVADRDEGLFVIDVSNPGAPVHVGGPTLSIVGGFEVVVAGDVAYLSSHTLLNAYAISNRRLDPAGNAGRSLRVNPPGPVVPVVRLSTTQVDTVLWQVTADGGAHWEPLVPGGAWQRLEWPGSDVRWRSTHIPESPWINPICSGLTLEWLTEAAAIDSIRDVPNDQGGWARLHFSRSAYDFAAEDSLPVTAYNVHRRVDDPQLPATLAARGRIVRGDREVHRPDGDRLQVYAAAGAGESVVELEDRFYRVVPVTSLAAPPGTWEVVGTVFAQQADDYICLVPTVADSADSFTYSTYYVSTHTTTPSVWFSSAPDSGYSIDNIAPSIPTGMMMAATGNGNQLNWDACPDEDFEYFRVYRGDDPLFVPGPGNLVHSTTEIEWLDAAGGLKYYKVTALDRAGNESPPASPDAVSGTGSPTASPLMLHPGVPNPFASSTMIRFDVPDGGRDMTLQIVDVSGRLVQTLRSGRQPAGRHSVAWHGRDDQGFEVGSGVYFCVLRADGFRESRKLLLRP